MSVIIRCNDPDCPIKGETFCNGTQVNLEIKDGKVICHTKAAWMNKQPSETGMVFVMNKKFFKGTRREN